MNGSLEAKRIEFTELSRLLYEYERKHNLSTIEFFRQYTAGELGDDEEMMLWAGLYHLYLTSLPVRRFMQTPLPTAA
jgi:hypothetical protein